MHCKGFLQGAEENLMYTLWSRIPNAHQVCRNLTTNTYLESLLSVKVIHNAMVEMMLVEGQTLTKTVSKMVMIVKKEDQGIIRMSLNKIND